MDEAALITLARGGDAGAWAALVTVHQGSVFRLAYLILGDAEEAEDVAQETFVRAFRALHRFDTTRPLRPWLLRIAANQARNHRRSAARYLAALTRLFQTAPPSPSGPDEQIRKIGESEALWQAIRRLRQTDQEIIYLRYFLELSEAETAAALSVPAGTVKSRLHRALDRLRQVAQEVPALAEGKG